MSVVTSVIVSVFAIDPAKEQTIIEDIQRWIEWKEHSPFEVIAPGGGEKNLTCQLLIGSFNCFETEKFRRFLLAHPFFDKAGEHVQIDLIVQEVDREDFARWRVLPMRERSFDEMGEEYKVLNYLSEKWEAEKVRIVKEEREACARIADELEFKQAFCYWQAVADDIAERIRARSDAKPG